MYFPQIKKTASGAAAPKNPNVLIIAIKDIATWPARNSKKVLMEGAFTLKPNPKMAEVYLTSSKTKAPYESDGDEDAISLKQKFEGEHPGTQLEINEFIADWLGEPCIVIHGSCQDAFKKVVGTACAPVQLKPAGQDDNDGRKHMLVFEQFAKTEWLPGHYTGQLPSVDPFAVVSGAAVALNPTNGSIYQLPSYGSSIPIVIASNTFQHGDIITLIGGGGAAAATLASGVTDKSALLVAGTTWVALSGAIINLKVFKAGALTLFTEVSRE